jgi:hypothetical protein
MRFSCKFFRANKVFYSEMCTNKPPLAIWCIFSLNCQGSTLGSSSMARTWISYFAWQWTYPTTCSGVWTLLLLNLDLVDIFVELTAAWQFSDLELSTLSSLTLVSCYCYAKFSLAEFIKTETCLRILAASFSKKMTMQFLQVNLQTAVLVPRIATLLPFNCTWWHTTLFWLNVLSCHFMFKNCNCFEMELLPSLVKVPLLVMVHSCSRKGQM